MFFEGRQGQPQLCTINRCSGRRHWGERYWHLPLRGDALLQSVSCRRFDRAILGTCPGSRPGLILEKSGCFLFWLVRDGRSTGLFEAAATSSFIGGQNKLGGLSLSARSVRSWSRVRYFSGRSDFSSSPPTY